MYEDTILYEMLFHTGSKWCEKRRNAGKFCAVVRQKPNCAEIEWI